MSDGLDEALVLEIRRRADQGEPYNRIAKDLGFTRCCISHAARGLTWSHIGGPIQKRKRKTGRPKGTPQPKGFKGRWTPKNYRSNFS